MNKKEIKGCVHPEDSCTNYGCGDCGENVTYNGCRGPRGNGEKEMIEEMAKDLEKVEKETYSKIVKETQAYVKEHHKYNSKEDYSLAHIKTVFELTAEEMIKLGYGKIPEGSVVLSMEKCIQANKVYSNATLKSWRKEDLIEHIRILEYNWASAEKCIDNQVKNFETLLKQARKETAEKIFSELYKKKIVSMDMRDNVEYLVFMKDILQLAKQFGVEIEE